MSVANEIRRLQSAKADIKTVIENKGVTVGDGTIDTYAEKISEISGGSSGDYEQGFEDGKNSVVPLERYVKEVKFTSINLFGTDKAIINLDNATSFTQMFASINEPVAVEHLTINCPNQITSMQQIFAFQSAYKDSTTLKRITLNVDTEKATNFISAFDGVLALEILDGQPINFSSTSSAYMLSAGLSKCGKLKEMRVVAKSIFYNFDLRGCSLLSTETIQSIIDGLADLTGGTAQILTLHSTVGGKLTDEQKATITAKNWTLVY